MIYFNVNKINVYKSLILIKIININLIIIINNYKIAIINNIKIFI